MSDHRDGLTVERPSPNELRMVRRFAAPRERVWEVYTEADHVRRWMLGPDGWTMPVCEQELRPGGSWRYVWRRDDGSEMEMSGEFREVVPHERVVLTERWGGEWPETENTLVLTDEDGGTTTLTMTVRYPTAASRDAAAATGMTDGAARSYERMDALLAGRE